MLPKCSGPCEGGPYDGKMLYHGTDRFGVAMIGNKVITYFGKPTKEITVHSYRFSEGKWKWHPKK